MKASWRFYFSLIYIGIIAGLIGACLTWLLHHIQHYAFGYGLSSETMSFRQGVEQSEPWRRWLVLTLCGLVAGAGWFALHRYGEKLRSIKQALADPQQGVPFGKTVCHALLQIITVGLGSPLGREVAPREIAVAFTSVWLKRLALSDEQAKLLLACASGAGLTAVYNVPFATTVFILETMVVVFSRQALFSALISVVIATLTSRLLLGDLVQYPDPINTQISAPLLIFSALIGLLIGLVANLFQRTTQFFPLIARNRKMNIIYAVLLFSLIGVIALYQPDILGNGKAGNQLTFAGRVDFNTSVQLFLLKWIVVLMALAVGAYGGLITPSMMLGSTLAYSFALLWNGIFPAISIETVALVGACTFLGISLKMPLTAIIFLLELTRCNTDLLMPMTLAMGVAMLSDKCYQVARGKISS